ncbi:MAG TPA: hypothetical protein VD794_16000 [Flavisolibacter sp.]|nr:hypothetical protein [Flavisolibacter sp.]
MKLRIEHYHIQGPTADEIFNEKIKPYLDEKFANLVALINNNFKALNMATVEQFQTILTRIDAATNQYAVDLQSLKNQIAGQGLSADVEESVLSQLSALADKMEAVGKVDPNSPDGEQPVEGGEGSEGGSDAGTDTGNETGESTGDRF